MRPLIFALLFVVSCFIVTHVTPAMAHGDHCKACACHAGEPCVCGDACDCQQGCPCVDGLKTKCHAHKVKRARWARVAARRARRHERHELRGDFVCKCRR